MRLRIEVTSMTITPSVDDAPAFVEAVRALTVGLLCTYAPPSVIVIKIDNFFGWRWLRFSGKWLGLLSIRNKKLNVPPFVPNRVVSQKTFIGQHTMRLRSQSRSISRPRAEMGFGVTLRMLRTTL